MGKLLATRMRSRRKELKLSQTELAEGICEQTQISRIERDIEYSPGAELVYALAKRLQVPMDYFFEQDSQIESDFLAPFRSLSKKLLDQRDYESLNYIYHTEAKRTTTLPLSDQLYLQWIEAIVLFHFNNNESEAMQKLENLLLKYNEYDWEYLNIANTLLNFYFISDHHSRFTELYQHMQKLFKHVTCQTIDELEILIKCRYNFCRFLWLTKKTEQAMNEIFDTIAICLAKNSLYCLADLYCLLGNVSEDFATKDVVLQCFITAQHIYQIEKNGKMALALERYICENF